jgi:hypothetical protein
MWYYYVPSQTRAYTYCCRVKISPTKPSLFKFQQSWPTWTSSWRPSHDYDPCPLVCIPSTKLSRYLGFLHPSLSWSASWPLMSFFQLNFYLFYQVLFLLFLTSAPELTELQSSYWATVLLKSYRATVFSLYRAINVATVVLQNYNTSTELHSYCEDHEWLLYFKWWAKIQ